MEKTFMELMQPVQDMTDEQQRQDNMDIQHRSVLSGKNMRIQVYCKTGRKMVQMEDDHDFRACREYRNVRGDGTG